MNRAAEQVVARFERWIGERILRLHDACVVIGVIAVDEEPLAQADFGSEVDAAGEGQVGVEKCSISKLAGRNYLTESAREAVRKTDDVVKASVEIIGGKLPAVRGKLLFDAGGPILAGLRLKIGITREAGIGTERLIEARLLDALAVKRVVPRVSEESFAKAQYVGASDARNHAGAKIAV